jgi:lipopolysaccharide/colanic/teichoic acid biosynthesis glycosyltransferase
MENRSGRSENPPGLNMNNLHVSGAGEISISRGPQRALRAGTSRARGAAIDAALKRALDIVVSLVLLLILAPLLLAVALLVKLESRGPILYRCGRPGAGGREIDVLKFRKMRDGSRGAALTVGADERFTRIGHILAGTRLDELPQLWNVLRGDMSLVGPRPEDPSFVTLCGPEYQTILRVRPGITGLSQLAFAKEREILVPDDPMAHYVNRLLPQKVRLDTLYALERTIAMDLRIIFWTLIPVVFRKDVSVNRTDGRLTLRRRGGRKGGGA